MKTIEEKIEDEIIEFEANRDSSEYYDPGYKTGFKTGAYWMKDELTRWRDPVNEPPKRNVSVFVKYETATGKLKYGVGRYFPLGIGSDWTVEGSTSRKIIGWRPIEEDSL